MMMMFGSTFLSPLLLCLQLFMYTISYGHSQNRKRKTPLKHMGENIWASTVDLHLSQTSHVTLLTGPGR